MEHRISAESDQGFLFYSRCFQQFPFRFSTGENEDWILYEDSPPSQLGFLYGIGNGADVEDLAWKERAPASCHCSGFLFFRKNGIQA